MGGEDILLVSCNLFNDIYILQLGKGIENFGNGDFKYIAGNRYNGSYRIIAHLHQDGGLGEFAAHGGQYYDGALYLASNDPSKCLVYRVQLGDKNTLEFEELNFNKYAGLRFGKLVYSYIDGLCIRDNKLYGQILNVNGIQSGKYVIVADLPDLDVI